MSEYLDMLSGSYTKSAYADRVTELLNNAEMQLIGQDIDFDSMVGTGHSGLLVLPILARHFDVPFFALRKDGISSHNSAQPYGDGRIGRKWILIDDVSVTGGTIKFAQNRIARVCNMNNWKTEYVGTYLYEPIQNAPGMFIYPDSTINSVKEYVNRFGEPAYAQFGIYDKVYEITETYDLDVPEAVTALVMSKFPNWDEALVNDLARYFMGY
jgi:hypoxanthine phosphoribosyltransferase